MTYQHTEAADVFTDEEIVQRAVAAKERAEEVESESSPSRWEEADCYKALADRGWSVRRIAEECGTNKDTVSRLRAGVKSPAALKREVLVAAGVNTDAGWRFAAFIGEVVPDRVLAGGKPLRCRDRVPRLADPVVHVGNLAVLHVEAPTNKASALTEDHSFAASCGEFDFSCDRVGTVLHIDEHAILDDGTEFASTYEQGEPILFALNSVIPG